MSFTFRFCELLRGKSFGRAAMNEVLREKFSALKGNVLDIGGGISPSYVAYLPASAERHTTDVRASEGVEYLDANKSFPYPDLSQENILAMNMLYILQDPSVALREIYRVLQPAGQFLASFPFFFPEYPEPKDYHRWTKQGVILHMQNAGFTKFEIIPAGGSGTVFAMSLMPCGGSRIVRICIAPIIFCWDLCSHKNKTCFWIVSATK